MDNLKFWPDGTRWVKGITKVITVRVKESMNVRGIINFMVTREEKLGGGGGGVTKVRSNQPHPSDASNACRDISVWTKVLDRATPPSKKTYDQRVNSGKVVPLYNSSKTTSLNPLPFIASQPPKCLFFWTLSAEFSLLRFRFICWVGGWHGPTQ